MAKSQGKYKGRLKKYNKYHEGMNYAVKLYHEGNMTVKQICKITNISKSSLYRRLSEEKNRVSYKYLQKSLSHWYKRGKCS
ncbi:helix-turn-helix domain-containing protein [Clostridium perfringens]|uniref:helix-turn-helix domain-containing protein n=1 Tax=Clostridium perfringens TaxID=1502 RepID=UPI003CC83F4B